MCVGGAVAVTSCRWRAGDQRRRRFVAVHARSVPAVGVWRRVGGHLTGARRRQTTMLSAMLILDEHDDARPTRSGRRRRCQARRTAVILRFQRSPRLRVTQYDTIRYSIITSHKSWRDGQPNLAHNGTETKKIRKN